MKPLFLTLLAVLSAVSLRAQAPEFPFRDPSLPQEQRIDDLLSRLTLQEKIDMMQNGSKGVERLGLPDYNWWNEALHGVARAGVATVFPQAIGMAATFDPEEHLRTFTTISDEARAKYNEAIRNGEHRQYYGLSFWTPNTNIFRDPRWGRGQATYGEDPYLTSVMGMAAVNGLQGDNPDYYKSHACAKHYAVHSGPESLRHSFNAVVSLRDLWETYLPAFEALVTEADVREVMGAYNRYDGEPCCSNDALLVDILRDRWNYQGMVVSDCGAISDFYRKGAHETHADAPSASADAVITGTDVECGSSYKTLTEAVEKGFITEADIDIAMRRIIRGWIELGMLDYADLTPWKDIPYSIVASKEHAKQALDVARKSMVLLKNDGVLPLKPGSVKKIAVLGPNAADSTMMLGNYNGDPTHVVTILDGIKAAYPNAEVTYERGCDLVEGFVAVPRAPRAGMNMAAQRQQGGQGAQSQGNTEWMGIPAQGAPQQQAQPRPRVVIPQPIISDNYTPDALEALASRAAESDVIIFVGGISPAVEGEELRLSLEGFAGGDRERIELPEIQSRVLKALHATGKPVIFVLCTGSAIALEQNEGDYDALITAWYGGQEGGTAVADVISGAYNPSGRLPITFYKSTAQLPDFLDYSMKGRTYRYMTEDPLYPFGFGLSYTNYYFSKPVLSSNTVRNGSTVRVRVNVLNGGQMDGSEAVQVYVKRLSDPNAPVKALKGLKMVNIKAGETKTVDIDLPASAFEYYDSVADGLVCKSGSYQILVGGSSADKDLQSVNLTIQ
ncbi:MAG: glycoside hydrolase family 3 C-terminal domain-containing protein [Bacteroidales bacterium]|nr:glycoside hydrolase family 3 C-terminal domain-containing protein [Bacteroidales bacterium]